MSGFKDCSERGARTLDLPVMGRDALVAYEPFDIFPAFLCFDFFLPAHGQ
jgi:hypothetical protein